MADVTIKGTTDADFPTVSFTQVLDNPTSASTNIVTNKDLVVSRYIANGVDSNALINVNISNSNFREFSVENLTPSISTFNQNTSKLSLVGSGGSAKIRVTIKGLGSVEYPVTLGHLGSATKDTVISVNAGSLYAHIISQLTAMVSGKTPSAATMQMYSGAFINPNLFCNYDFTGSNKTGERHTLLSTDHYITANHAYGGRAGGMTTYLGSDGVTYTRTILADIELTGISDTRVGIYSTPVPAVVKPFKLLPTNYLTKLPNASAISNYPCLTISGHTQDTQLYPNDTQEQTLIITGISKFSSTIDNYPYAENYATIFDSWSKKGQPSGNQAIGGDSNRPSFLPINGELILLTNQYQPLSTPNYAYASAEIQAAMDTLSTANGKALKTIQYAELSAFTTY